MSGIDGNGTEHGTLFTAQLYQSPEEHHQPRTLWHRGGEIIDAMSVPEAL